MPQFARHFPEAKFVLTLRDPESWYESAAETIFDGLELSAHNPNPGQRESSALKRNLILPHTFAGRHREKAYALAVYRRHQEQVAAASRAAAAVLCARRLAAAVPLPGQTAGGWALPLAQ